MADSMETLCKTLGIDRIVKHNFVYVIEEQHGTNANFLLHSFLWQALKRGQPVCLLLCHNDVAHYDKISMRYGLNLLSLRKTGQITIISLMQYLAIDMITNASEETVGDFVPETPFSQYKNLAYHLFTCVKDQCQHAKFNTSILFVIENLDHLLDLGINVRDTMRFLRYLRSYLAQTKSELCILVHTYKEMAQYSDPDMLLKMLQVLAQLSITTEPLESGFSFNASGKLIVHWRHEVIRSRNNWTEKAIHLYKLMDSYVRIFPPGATSILA